MSMHQRIRAMQGRLACAWHVLRGRPLIYRVHFDDGIRINGARTPHLLVRDIQASARPAVYISLP
jgi:hypothetical protein